MKNYFKVFLGLSLLQLAGVAPAYAWNLLQLNPGDVKPGDYVETTGTAYESSPGAPWGGYSKPVKRKQTIEVGSIEKGYAYYGDYVGDGVVGGYISLLSVTKLAEAKEYGGFKVGDKVLDADREELVIQKIFSNGAFLLGHEELPGRYANETIDHRLHQPGEWSSIKKDEPPYQEKRNYHSYRPSSYLAYHPFRRRQEAFSVKNAKGQVISYRQSADGKSVEVLKGAQKSGDWEKCSASAGLVPAAKFYKLLEESKSHGDGFLDDSEEDQAPVVEADLVKFLSPYARDCSMGAARNAPAAEVIEETGHTAE